MNKVGSNSVFKVIFVRNAFINFNSSIRNGDKHSAIIAFLQNEGIQLRDKLMDVNLHTCKHEKRILCFEYSYETGNSTHEMGLSAVSLLHLQSHTNSCMTSLNQKLKTNRYRAALFFIFNIRIRFQS